MRFEFATAGRILFGPGTLKDAGALAAEFGRRAFVTVGRGTQRAAPLLDLLTAAGIAPVVFEVTGEPTTDLIRVGAQQAVEAGSEVVIGFGGGSAMDAAKAIAALAANRGDPLDYLEVVGKGLALAEPALPTIAIPTTAGTGAEVTRNAVLLSPQHGVKVSLRSVTMLPKVAVVDPELTLSLPPAVTATTGLDALTQLIEPFVSSRANPMTDAFCRAGIACAVRSLRRAYENGADLAAREDMSLASLLGGLSLANAGLGVAHGFAGAIGGAFDAPHGAICAALLPHVIGVNCHALRARRPESPAPARYDEVARIVTGSAAAKAADGAAWLGRLAAGLGIPPLSAYGIRPAHAPDIVAKTALASSTKGNPIVLTAEELTQILELAL